MLPAGCRFLVLEDEYLIALDIQDMLENNGAGSVSCFATADMAMAALNDGAAFELAILDVNLGTGGRTGMAVAAELTARGTPFVFLTGMSSDAARDLGYDVPVLEKPYQQTALLEAIRNAMALE